MSKKSFDISSLMQSKVTWAVIAELLILLVCFLIRPDFFSISYQPFEVRRETRVSPMDPHVTRVSPMDPHVIEIYQP